MDLIALTAIIAAGTKFYLSYKPREKDKLADNSFKANLSTLEDKKGLSLAKGIKLSPKACSEGIIIFAPTGEGKTTSIYFPALLDENIEGSLIVADPKGELYRETAHFQEKVCHRKVYVYAPFDPICSNQYNILEQCKSVTEVKQLAQNLLMNGSLSLEIQTGKKSQGIEWLQMSESLLTSSLLYCKENKKNCLRKKIN
jgi:type IV secretion system protein VirD4